MEVDFVNELSPKAARAQPLDLAVPHLPSSDLEAVKLLNTSCIRGASIIVMNSSQKILMAYFSYCLKCCLRVTFQQNNASEQRRSDIILAVKESNKTTRNMAYDLLVQIGHACGDEDQGGNKENLQQLFNMVAGGLAGETPQMISAAVKGLARLAYEFSDLVLSACNVLASLFLLLQRKNREIIKVGSLSVDAGYYFCQTPAEWLQTHLRSVAEGLSRWQNDSKKLFKAKVGIQVNLFLFVICFRFFFGSFEGQFCWLVYILNLHGAHSGFAGQASSSNAC
ncbi:hypothetical protein MKW98_019843 [Papaver atlanticum]|uniref:Uncharacterized protein n=1 Tax=Papaver atlanticum TaxID=357466 RepID=A0AAD4S191_9MAGN|nr:hypothetical protein MKW98_019843 [Papaver atlanticum]